MNRFVTRIALMSLACALLVVASPAQAAEPTAKVKGVITLVLPTGKACVITSSAGVPVPLVIKSDTKITINGKPADRLTLFVTWIAITKIGGTEPATAVFVPGLETALSITAGTRP